MALDLEHDMSKLFILLLTVSLFANPIDSYASSGTSYCDYYKGVKSAKTEESELWDKLTSEDVNVRVPAASKLACVSNHPDRVIAALINLFDEPNGEARMEVIEAAAAMGEFSVPYLIEALESGNVDKRRGACISLRMMGPIAISAVPALEMLYNEPGYDVSMAAKRAVKAIKYAK